MSIALHPRSKEEVEEMITRVQEAMRKIEARPNGTHDFLVKGGFINENGQIPEYYLQQKGPPGSNGK